MIMTLKCQKKSDPTKTLISLQSTKIQSNFSYILLRTHSFIHSRTVNCQQTTGKKNFFVILKKSAKISKYS